MMFSEEKCKVMHIGRGNKEFVYTMNGKQLQVISNEKDLGEMMTNDLKSSEQCIQAYNRASRMLGMLGRTIVSRSPEILVKLYKSIVRPHLEYCTPAWSPHYKKDKELLEKVQHRFTRMFRHLKDRDYSYRLQQLGLWTLEERRNRSDLLEVFKMAKGLSATPLQSFFTLDTASRTRGHPYKLKKNYSKGSRLIAALICMYYVYYE